MRHHVLGLIVIALSVAAQPAPSYRVTRSFTLGGDGSWDYVVPDPAAHRVFIGRQTRVMVVDENSGALLGEVTGDSGCARDGNRRPAPAMGSPHPGTTSRW